MTKAEAREVLIRYNAWRRYNGPLDQTPLQPEPKEIGEAIDVAIGVLPEEEASLDEAAKRYAEDIWLYGASWKEAARLSFIAGAQWAVRQGWTFDAHKGAFGICFDGNIDNLLDSLKDKEEVTVQIRKKEERNG